MKLTVISKNYGSQTINTESFNPLFASTSSPIFKMIEHIFDNWYSKATEPGAPMNKDIKGMYEGECDQFAIYSKKGAIRQAIENMIELAEEENKKMLTTKDLISMDLEAAFI